MTSVRLLLCGITFIHLSVFNQIHLRNMHSTGMGCLNGETRIMLITRRFVSGHVQYDKEQRCNVLCFNNVTGVTIFAGVILFHFKIAI